MKPTTKIRVAVSTAFAMLAQASALSAATTLFQADFNGTTVSDVGGGVFLAQITETNLEAGTSVGDWTVNTAQALSTNRALRSIQGVGAANVTNKALRFGIDLAGWGASPILTANLSSAATLAAGEITVGFDYANATGDAGGGRTFFLRGVGADNLTVFELAFKSDAGHTRLAYRDSTNTINLLGTATDLVSSTGSSNNASGDYDDTIMKHIDVVIGSSTFDVFLAGVLLGDDLPFKSAGATGLNRLEFVSSTQWTGGWFDNMSVTQVPISGNTYATWIDDYLGVGAFTGLGDDPDGDGSDNGVENFFGTDPSASSGGLVAGAVSGSTFTFTHPQNATPASDLTAAYQWSQDLATFYASGASDGTGTTVAITAQPDTPAVGTTTVTATITGTATSKLFVNVKVTQN
jgi:hypothetical protein